MKRILLLASIIVCCWCFPTFASISEATTNAYDAVITRLKDEPGFEFLMQSDNWQYTNEAVKLFNDAKILLELSAAGMNLGSPVVMPPDLMVAILTLDDKPLYSVNKCQILIGDKTYISENTVQLSDSNYAMIHLLADDKEFLNDLGTTSQENIKLEFYSGTTLISVDAKEFENFDKLQKMAIALYESNLWTCADQDLGYKIDEAAHKENTYMHLAK